MKATVKIYKNDGDTNGLYPIKIILFYKTTRRKTISYSALEDWNEKTQLPRISHPEYNDLYPEVIEIKKIEGKKSFKGLTDFDKAFRILLNSQGQIIDDPCYYSYADKRIAYMHKLNRDGNAEAYLLFHHILNH